MYEWNRVSVGNSMEAMKWKRLNVRLSMYEYEMEESEHKSNHSMYEYEMEESERKGITVCMGMKWKRVKRKGITVCMGMKWKRVNVRYHSMYG